MNVQEKQAFVSSLVERLSAADATFVIDYKGCSCSELTQIRGELRETGASMSVIKNTLLKRAVNQASIAGMDELFVGPTAVVLTETPVESAKVLAKYSKEFADDDKFTLRGGYLDGNVVDKAGVIELSKLPSKEELYGKLLGLLQAPASQLVRMLNAPAGEMVRLLAAWRDELEKKGS